jgi:acyl-CoA synthetase (AMP-forming)/AMP-acid ligase II
MCVQIKPGSAFAEEQLIAWGKERLASYKLPKKVYRLDKFPRSANGKVLRSKIPKELGIV